MAENALAAEARGATGKGVARKLRAAGRIPGVLYGKGKPSEAISVDPRALEHVLHESGSGMNTLIALDTAGGQRTVLIKELQRDPVRGRYLHADFYEVDLRQKITVAVPIHLEGKAKGIEFGGVLDQTLREIEVECLPTEIPESIDVDVSGLDIGDSLHVYDLQLPAGVELVTESQLSIANVEVPAALESETAEAEVAEGEEPVEGEAADEKAAETEEGGGEG